jgi:hypothetical protein
MGSMKNRLSLFGVMASLAAIAVLSFAVPVTQAANTLTLSVDVDEGSFENTGFPGAFNVEGAIDGGPAGGFQCWGWIFVDEATTNVSQVYNIAGRGAIMTQGQEGGLLAVVGGTGDFRNVSGEGLQVFTGPGFDFTIEFDLRGARR